MSRLSYPAAGGLAPPTLPEILERLRERPWEPLSTAELARAHDLLMLNGFGPSEGHRWLEKMIHKAKQAMIDRVAP